MKDDDCPDIQHGCAADTSPRGGGSGIAITLKVSNSGISFLIAAVESQIKASLISLLDGIKRSDGAVIAREMTRLDDLLAESRAAGNLHPQLDHFLGNRSYAKALMFLGGETDIPAGACGGRPAKG